MILQLFVSVLIFIGLMQNSCKAITFEEDVTLTLAQKGLLDEVRSKSTYEKRLNVEFPKY